MRGRIAGEDDLVAQVGAGEGIDLEEQGMHEDLGQAVAIAFEDFDHFGFEGEVSRMENRGHDENCNNGWRAGMWNSNIFRS